MSFFGDLGQWGSDFITGRWMGGETNLAHDNWTPIATLAGAAATGGAALSGLGAAGGLGGLLGAGEAAGGAGTALAGGAELGGGGIEGVLGTTAPDLLGAYGPQGVSATAAGMEPASDATIQAAMNNPEFMSAFGEAKGGSMLGGMSGVAPGETIGNVGDAPITFDAPGMGTNTDPEMTGAMAPGGGGGGGGGGGMPMNLAPNAPGGGAPGGAGFFDKFTSGIGSQITKNPLGALGAGIGAIGLGANLMHGNPASADENMLRNQATGMNAQAGQLMGYLQNGTLPPGLQAKLDQDKRAARAGAIARAGKAGLGTDPKFNSALAQEFAAIDLAALATEGQLANDLLKTGLQELNYSGTDLAQLIKVQQQRDQATGQAIANFAAALGRAGASSSLKG